MKSITQRAVKSITRNALLISMVLHVFLLIMLFYLSVANQPVLSIQDRVDVSIEQAPRQPLSKPPMKLLTPQHRKTTVYEPTQIPLAKMESITPQIAFQPTQALVEPIVTEQPILKQTNTEPQAKTDISTAFDDLRQVESGLSKTRAESTVGGSFGTKRSGAPGVQRTLIRTTLDLPESSYGDDDIKINMGDVHGDIPYVSFSNVMKKLGNEIVETSGGGPIDVVFVIDASGSMADNIKAVADHLVDMVDVYKSSGIDYQLGLTEFSTHQKKSSRKPENKINILQLTESVPEYKRSIYAIRTSSDENALDAIAKTVNEMKFRATSKKHLILVTDEPFTSIEGLTTSATIDLCREYGIYVNVLGLPNKEHRTFADETNGKWHAIPEDPEMQQRQRRNTPATPRAKGQALRKAQWQNVQKIGKKLLQNSANTPVDIVLFIDGSKSMEDKRSEFLQQLDLWIRDWDNALIDYQIGVVRFRKRTSLNLVNVFNPPQTLKKIRKIVELPCQDDENLLHAITEGLRRIKLRPNAQTHLILVTDEPIENNKSVSGVIQFLEDKQIVVSVIGTYDDFQEEVTIKTGGMWVPIPAGHLGNNTNW